MASGETYAGTAGSRERLRTRADQRTADRKLFATHETKETLRRYAVALDPGTWLAR